MKGGPQHKSKLEALNKTHTILFHIFPIMIPFIGHNEVRSLAQDHTAPSGWAGI